MCPKSHRSSAALCTVVTQTSHSPYLSPYLLAFPTLARSNLPQHHKPHPKFSPQAPATHQNSSPTSLSRIHTHCNCSGHLSLKPRTITRLGMDDYHHQPIWPMIQGAANYAWNLIEEAWSMIWPQRTESSRIMIHGHERALHAGEMSEVDRKVQFGGRDPGLTTINTGERKADCSSESTVGKGQKISEANMQHVELHLTELTSDLTTKPHE
ncbi:hypothetical protein FB567DRAFT_619536 [Paraphoma chrysanthemicola]|uniref:Uncharacterized protein n=1 Tax=Paraphoma chrysanthemicola TaxID=798071 RepID=A0A8K0R9V1_9PLEO|nr:hypothetical protein FB567DRAFT_619536 [Paraphoma chrysanthemicola]